jgi:hypothetical protein
MTEPTRTPSKLWKRMTSEQRLLAARAFWKEEQATDDQIQAVMLISQQKKFRPKTVLSLDDDRKARHFAGLANLPDALAARALVVYHLAEQRPMMAAFLDALGIAHENGLIQDDAVKPDPEKVAAAVKTISEQFPHENVTLYLDTLLCQDPETWGALSEVQEGATPEAAEAGHSEIPELETGKKDESGPA